jgi:phosphate transport system substrate-binding protein
MAILSSLYQVPWRVLRLNGTVAAFLFLIPSVLLTAGGTRDLQVSGTEWLRFEGEHSVVDPSAVAGPIHMVGSSTVLPAAEYAAVLFRDAGYEGILAIDSIGSGGGFRRYIAGSADLVTASRAMKPEEAEEAKAAGRQPVSFQIGTDAVTVAVHPANSWVSAVTMDEIATIFAAGNWSDVNPLWPDKPIGKFVPGTDSGTFDYFIDRVFDGTAAELLESPNLQLSEDDNVLVRGVQDGLYSIGFFGYSYYRQSRDSLQALNPDGFGPETASRGEYPLSRRLYIYADRQSLQSNTSLAAWILFLLDHSDEAMTATGYFPAPADETERSKRLVLDIIGESP